MNDTVQADSRAAGWCGNSEMCVQLGGSFFSFEKSTKSYEIHVVSMKTIFSLVKSLLSPTL
jgi:hypothetical protein